MKGTVTVQPQSNLEKETLKRRELVRGFATVLAWADDADVVALDFDTAESSCFLFRFSDGKISNQCRNISDPPVELRREIIHSVIRTGSANTFSYYLNRFCMARCGKRMTVQLEVPTTERTSFWDLLVSRHTIEAKRTGTTN